jgi:hypothetical protein
MSLSIYKDESKKKEMETEKIWKGRLSSSEEDKNESLLS